MNNYASVPVGVLGASGYAGRELLALLNRHPGASVAFATAETGARKKSRGGSTTRTVAIPSGAMEPA